MNGAPTKEAEKTGRPSLAPLGSRLHRRCAKTDVKQECGAAGNSKNSEILSGKGGGRPQQRKVIFQQPNGRRREQRPSVVEIFVIDRRVPVAAALMGHLLCQCKYTASNWGGKQSKEGVQPCSYRSVNFNIKCPADKWFMLVFLSPR